MTTSRTPRFSDAAPLRTDADVLERVEALVGTAASPSTLWLLLVDGDDRQAPVVLPVHDMPRRPDETLDGLGALLRGVVPDLATDSGPGSAVLVRERLGDAAVTDDDRAWATALVDVCQRCGVRLRGVFASTPRGVHRLR